MNRVGWRKSDGKGTEKIQTDRCELTFIEPQLVPPLNNKATQNRERSESESRNKKEKRMEKKRASKGARRN